MSAQVLNASLARGALSPVGFNPGMAPTSSEPYLEQMRVTEALLARDHAIHTLENVCASNRAKEAVLVRLRAEKENLEARLAGAAPAETNHECCKDAEGLRKVNEELAAKVEALTLKEVKGPKDDVQLGIMASTVDVAAKLSPPAMPDFTGPAFDTPRIVHEDIEAPENITRARYAVLSELPVPRDLPDDMLVPFIIPTPFTLQDFLGTITGQFRAQLNDYRVFQDNTTSWCPDREEHGYYLAPIFKCSTNPRVVTAHRWYAVDLDGELNKTTECFYNKDGKWYYAGVYKTFRLRDLAPQEWAKLPPETTQALIKETIQHRKNVSPQNVYETGQLYAAGALKAACVGLQCIGFNDALYNGLLAQAELCAKTGRWRVGSAGALAGDAVWNVGANANTVDAVRTGSPKMTDAVADS